MPDELIPIPPMPELDDFRDEYGCVSHIAYDKALATWERIAALVVAQKRPQEADRG